jgi:8-amino-7-oxononanoate synthase
VTGQSGDLWPARLDARLAETAAAGRWRAPRRFDARGPGGRLDGEPVVSFAGNDYLGLSVHPAVIAAAHQALDRWGTGAGASRLVTGSRPVHHQLEEALAHHYGTERAVVFPTGYAANLGVLATLGGPGTRIVSDERNHASIIDGCRLSRAEVRVYRHGDVDHASALLAEAAAQGRPTLAVTDTVFSMDGDTAPLDELAEACRRHRALLVLDEAHAVLGPHPGDAVTAALTVVRVGTLSKTLGSLGGSVAADHRVADLLVNAARPYIFTTAPTPADAAAALAALQVLDSPEGVALTRRLAMLVDRVRPGHPSAIVPVIVGDENEAVAASDALAARGLWVPAIRPPTVAPGTSRLRVTLSAAHRDEEVDRLVAALAHLVAAVPTA